MRKKDGKDTKAYMTHVRKKEQSVFPISFKKTQRPVLGSEDHRIRVSRGQNHWLPALGEVTSSRGFGQNRGKDDKWNTPRKKRGLPRCTPSAVGVIEFMSWHKVSPSKVVIRRTPVYPFSGKG